ncbi:MAG: hypothetical protein D6696_13075 [Acidobacteria bacterium]|nr:MAG: hypothetical protein D6696_13075 [Acidobacteriota bacterium]
MSSFTLFVLAACPLAWTVLDLLRKRLAAHGRTVPLTLLVVAAHLPPTAVWLLWDGGLAVGPGYWRPGLVALALNLVANLAYMRSVALSPLSTTLPLLSLTPAFTTLLGVPLLGEMPGPRPAAGIVLVVAGALILNSDPRRGFSPTALLRALFDQRGGPYMALVALLWAAVPLFEKLALHHASLPMHAFLQVTGITLALGLWLAATGRARELVPQRDAVLLLAATGLVGMLALGLQLVAIQRVWVGLVETVKRGAGAVMALVYGRLLLGEEVPPQRLAAVALMLVGVWLALR